uniref:Uncharacterized protein n=1 Tax=Oryza barthii TaxID=65489 RepID=A0A0D3HE42_9ORYZ
MRFSTTYRVILARYQMISTTYRVILTRYHAIPIMYQTISTTYHVILARYGWTSRWGRSTPTRVVAPCSRPL